MRKRIDQILWAVAVMDGVNTIIQTATKMSSLGLSPDTWLIIGLVIFFGIILALMARSNRQIFHPRESAATENKEKGLPLNTETISSLIFQCVYRLDAVQLRQGRNYVSLNYRLISALPCDLKLARGKASLIIDNESTEEWVLDPVTIKKQSNDSWYKDITLGEKISTSARERLQGKVAVRVRLIITYWDYEGKEYHFNTEVSGLEIIAL